MHRSATDRPAPAGKRVRRLAAWLAAWFYAAVCFAATGMARAESPFEPVYPIASGTKTLGNSNVTIDISHIDLGYIMVKHKGSTKRLKVTTTLDGTEMKFDLNGDGEYETYPLTMGDGKYVIAVYEEAGTEKDKYARIFNEAVRVKMPAPNMVYLIPNQYCWYTPEMLAVAKSFELCEGITNDWQKLNILYDYVSTNVIYDHVKAFMVQKPYLPVVDDTLTSGTGICFDYAALLACMLRVQGIPTQLVIGRLTALNPPGSHAWNKVYINGTWNLVDPTFRNSNFSQSDYLEERLY